jgi:murein DD-endopeptidase MepM/ murein hydrolase activator NlpD
MANKNYRVIVLIGILIALLTGVCSSGYVTPGSLTATAVATRANNTPLPTAFYASPTFSPPTETIEESREFENTSSVISELEYTPTAESTPEEITPTPIDTKYSPNQQPLLYYSQAGDTLSALMLRFGVDKEEIVSDEPIPEEGFIKPGQMLMIPLRLANTTSSDRIIPDSEIVYSPSTVAFDPVTYINTIGGYLSRHKEYLGTSGWNTGAELVRRISLENSINPRILLSLLEYQSGWVLGEPHSISTTDYPMGKVDYDLKGLNWQLVWSVNQLTAGYYGWRAGILTELEFKDGSRIRLAPDLNAGTVAVMYFFSQLYSGDRWMQAVDAAGGLLALHTTMFSDPWARAVDVEPLLPQGLEQPNLMLPFMIGQVWSFTSGPHGAWTREGALAALDFAPGSVEHGCVDSDLWVLAAAPGMVVRRGKGVVVLDLDGDGYEQTGWAILYLHLTDVDRIRVGTWLDKGDLIGHPSCEGGASTGTHLHIARKYNGEWMLADGPIPFVMSGWRVHAGDEPYEGYLTRGDEIIPANVYGTAETKIVRRRDDP